MRLPQYFQYAFSVGVLLISGNFLTFRSCSAFSVAPNGLTGVYRGRDLTPSTGNGVYITDAKSGRSRSHFGVSWSRNLDAEIKLRKQLCPHISGHIGYQYRFHNGTQACYKVGDKGPCGDNMIFFGYQSNAVYGECDCNYNDNTRALIMDPKGNSCHFIYSRGYCKEGEWLAFTPGWDPICEATKCRKFYENIDPNHNAIIPLPIPGVLDNRKNKGGASLKAVSVEFVPYLRSKSSSTFSCVPLGLSCEDKDMDQESLSQWGSLTHLPHEVQFIKGKLTPRCAPSSDHINWRYPTPKMQCLPGSFLMGVAKSNGKSKCDHGMEI